jgi:hypothetical protein
MPKLSSDEILIEIGADPLDGSGFESEEPEAQDDKTSVNPEVAE